MMKKGYVLTWDAVIALMFILFVLVGFLSIPYFKSIGTGEVGFQQAHLTSEDAMEVLSKSGKLSVIGAKWTVGDIDGASNATKDFLETIVPEHVGYELYMGDTLIYSSELDSGSDRINKSNSKDKTRAIRFISGYTTENATRGWVASAALYQNLSDNITTLYYVDGDYSVVNMTLSKDNTERIAYLVVPRTAFVYNGTMNISWLPLCYPDCPIGT